MKVYQAINKVQQQLSVVGISKDRTNLQGASYKFRGIDDVYNTLSPMLANNGLCILPRVLKRECVERRSNADKALFYVTVEVEFDLVSSEDGTKHTIKTFGEAMDSGDKATNKAMSAAYKYACFQAFAIPTEGDNDSDSQTHEVKVNAAVSLEEFERQHLQNLRNAAMEGKDALRDAYAKIPKSDIKDAFYKKHGEILVKAAEMVEVKS